MRQANVQMPITFSPQTVNCCLTPKLSSGYNSLISNNIQVNTFKSVSTSIGCSMLSLACSGTSLESIGISLACKRISLECVGTSFMCSGISLECVGISLAYKRISLACVGTSLESIGISLASKGTFVQYFFTSVLQSGYTSVNLTESAIKFKQLNQSIKYNTNF